MVKNPPASAGDSGLIPPAGKSQVLQSSELWEPQPWSPRARAALEQPPPGRACLGHWGAQPCGNEDQHSPKKTHTSNLLKTKGKGKVGMAEGRKEEGQGTG